MNLAWISRFALRHRIPLPRIAAGLALVLLSACGFQMRGTTPLPFDSLYMSMPDNRKFTADLRRAIKASSPGTRMADSAKEAQVILQQVSSRRSRREVSLNPQGRVEEYELSVRFTFRLIDSKGNAIIPDTTLSAYRQMPYDAQVVQAKASQMDVLYSSMEQSLVSRVLRRLTADDVREAYARLQRGEVDPNAPVFNPNQSYEQDSDTPSDWSSPSNDLGSPDY
jgi:LPS-assembly lipoprotein